MTSMGQSGGSDARRVWGYCSSEGRGDWTPVEREALSRLVAERDRYREALDAIVIFTRPPHNKIGEACGVDACCGCLIEGTAREALNG